jgi:hypothetical protein
MITYLIDINNITLAEGDFNGRKKRERERKLLIVR